MNPGVDVSSDGSDWEIVPAQPDSAATVGTASWPLKGNHLKQQIKNGLNLDRGPIIHTAIQQKRFEIAQNLIEHG